MIPYYPVSSIDLGFIKLHVWGIFAAIGFLVAIYTAARQARRKGLDPEVVYDVAPWIIIGSIIGARLVFILENPSAVESALDIIAVWNGGLAFHGGFFGAIVAFLVYTQRRKLNFWKYADAIAPSIALGHAVGRIGCLATGLHIGKEANVPWAFLHDGVPRHPTPLYEILGLVPLFFFLRWLSFRKVSRSFDGFIFAAYVALYSALRFFVEFYRTDPAYYLGLTAAQFIVIGLFVASLGVMIYNLLGKNKLFVAG